MGTLSCCGWGSGLLNLSLTKCSFTLPVLGPLLIYIKPEFGVGGGWDLIFLFSHCYGNEVTQKHDGNVSR